MHCKQESPFLPPDSTQEMGEALSALHHGLGGKRMGGELGRVGRGDRFIYFHVCHLLL